MKEIFDEELKKIGIYQYGMISTEEIIFQEEIRKICEANTCRLYGKSWACPPAVGTVWQCKERCLEYSNAMVFSAKYSLKDPFDYEGMIQGHGEFKKLCDRLYFVLNQKEMQFLILSNEGCNRCENCTYPENPCRFPEMLFPSIEGYGIYVSEIAKNAKIAYNNGKNTVTYFGMVLYKNE